MVAAKLVDIKFEIRQASFGWFIAIRHLDVVNELHFYHCYSLC